MTHPTIINLSWAGQKHNHKKPKKFRKVRAPYYSGRNYEKTALATRLWWAAKESSFSDGSWQLHCKTRFAQKHCADQSQASWNFVDQSGELCNTTFVASLTKENKPEPALAGEKSRT